MSIRALIVDDEPLARRAIRRMLERHADIEIVQECGDGDSAISSIPALRPDLVFLDVQMPGTDGFSVIERIGTEKMPPTIFVTAYDRYALAAFDADAVDYVLKPIAAPRFDRALNRAREQLAGKHRDPQGLERLIETLRSAANRTGYAARLPVLDKGRIVLVAAADIHWIGAEGNYVRLHTASTAYEVRETLAGIGAKLDPADFVRIHRSTIVNLRHVKEVYPWFGGYHLVRLVSGQELRMSRYQQHGVERLGVGNARAKYRP